MEQNIEVPQHDDVGIYENDLVVIRQLPQPKLAVVVLVVGAVLGLRVSDPGYDPDLPAGGGERAALGGGDGLVEEEDQVAFGSGLEEALRKRYGAADVAFGGVENGGVGLAF